VDEKLIKDIEILRGRRATRNVGNEKLNKAILKTMEKSP
jgi:hypothetical protein